VSSEQEALRQAWFPGTTSPLGDGHINATFLVNAEHGQFVLQKINARVFAKPLDLVANFNQILPYLEKAGLKVVRVINTKAGGSAFVARDGGVWRLTEYVKNTVTLQRLVNLKQAHNAGLAFASFQTALAKVPVTALHVAIPEFLQLNPYLDALKEAIEKNSFSDKQLLSVVANNKYLGTALGDRKAIIHGDCKVNNLRFDSRDEVRCVLDLDTVMVGHPAWDWGDLARSGVMDLNRQMKCDVLVALAEGFQQAVALDRNELVLAPQYVAFMLGVRFLTDHLLGDVYFRVSATGENLIRAKKQFDVLRWFQDNEAQLEKI